MVMVGVMHRPDVWTAYWVDGYLGHLGYQTKLAMLIAATFVLGNTVDSALGALAGGIMGGVAGYKGTKQAENPGAEPAAVTAYWKDASWRNMVSAYLGKAAPENLQPIADQAEYDQAVNLAKLLPPAEQAREFAKIARRSSQVVVDHNDAVWQAYWGRLHSVAVRRPGSRIEQSLELVASFGTAGLVVLVAAPWTPQLRHWWIVLPCLYYVLVGTLQQVIYNPQNADPAQVFDQQWQYMRTHVAKGEDASESSWV